MAWDDEEFAAVFKQLYGEVRRFLECLLGNRTSAQDTAQEAFMRLYRKGYGVPRSEVRFWIFRVARNLALNEIVKAETRKKLTGNVVEMQRPNMMSPEKQYEQTQREQIITDLLKSLPEDQRAALVLREQQEMSYREIARVLQVSESKVKVDIHRARIYLRDRWNEIENRPAQALK
jgi:RNA polymerase sigma-70 factor (ECF subfamily)